MFAQLKPITEVNNEYDIDLIKVTYGAYVEIKKHHPLYESVLTKFDYPIDKILDKTQNKIIIFRVDNFNVVDALLSKLKEVDYNGYIFVASDDVDVLEYIKNRTKGEIRTLVELDIISHNPCFYERLLKEYRIDGIIFELDTFNKLPDEVLTLSEKFFILVKGYTLNSELHINNLSSIDFIIVNNG